MTHLCPSSGGGGGRRCLGVSPVWEGIGKELFRRMLWMMISSCRYSPTLSLTCCKGIGLQSIYVEGGGLRCRGSECR